WLHQPAERSDVAKYVSRPAAEGGASNPHRGPVDLDGLAALRMTVEHDARTAKSIGDDAVGTGLDVTPLDGQHSLRVRQVPFLATVALLETGQHQLRAH